MKNLKLCQLCHRPAKLYKVHTEKNKTEMWCLRCVYDEEHLTKPKPKRNPLDCFGVNPKGVGKISLSPGFKLPHDTTGHW